MTEVVPAEYNILPSAGGGHNESYLPAPRDPYSVPSPILHWLQPVRHEFHSFVLRSVSVSDVVLRMFILRSHSSTVLSFWTFFIFNGRPFLEQETSPYSCLVDSLTELNTQRSSQPGWWNASTTPERFMLPQVSPVAQVHSSDSAPFERIVTLLLTWLLTFIAISDSVSASRSVPDWSRRCCRRYHEPKGAGSECWWDRESVVMLVFRGQSHFYENHEVQFHLLREFHLIHSWWQPWPRCFMGGRESPQAKQRRVLLSAKPIFQRFVEVERYIAFYRTRWSSVLRRMFENDQFFFSRGIL